MYNIFIVVGLTLLFNNPNAIRIEKMLVPELVEIGNASEIVMDCEFSDVFDEMYTLRWYFKRNEIPVYQWTPRTIPRVRGILKGRLDLTYHASLSTYDKHRALRIVRLSPELTGEYTCNVEQNGTEVRRTKTMLVFSPEEAFDIKINQHDHVFNVICTVRGLYPSPDLIIEYKNEPIARQEQRVWRSNSEGMLYDAESSARLAADCRGTVTCRLSLPEAGYTAIKQKTAYDGDTCRKNGALNNIITLINVELLGMAFTAFYLLHM